VLTKLAVISTIMQGNTSGLEKVVEKSQPKFYLLFIENLHGIVFSGGFMLHEHHSTKRTGTQGFYSIEII